MKAGDSVTLSASFSVPNPANRYEPFKPHASLTRVLSDDVAGDLAEMEESLQQLTRRSLAMEMTEYAQVLEMLDNSDGDMDVFMDELLGTINAESETRKVAEGRAAQGGKANRKSNTKKARRK